MGDCQNYGPFLGPYYNTGPDTGPDTGPNLGDPKRDHNFDNPPNRLISDQVDEAPKSPGKSPWDVVPCCTYRREGDIGDYIWDYYRGY